MAILTNRGRTISDLPVATSINSDDDLILQKTSGNGGLTQRLPFSLLKSTLIGNLVLSNYSDTVNFINLNNKFSGSFYSPDTPFEPNKPSANLYTLRVRKKIILDTGGTLEIPSIVSNGAIVCNYFASNINANLYGTSTLVNATIQTGVIQSLSANSITLPNGGTISGVGTTTITTTTGNFTTENSTYLNSNVAVINSIRSANSKMTGSFKGTFDGTFVGSLGISSITGDILSPTSQLVLDNGSGPANDAKFYGTSSYANTASIAISSSHAEKSDLSITSKKLLPMIMFPKSYLLASSITNSFGLVDTPWRPLESFNFDGTNIAGTFKKLEAINVLNQSQIYSEYNIQSDDINHVILRAEIFGKVNGGSQVNNGTYPYVTSIKFFTFSGSKDIMTSSLQKSLSINFFKPDSAFKTFCQNTSIITLPIPRNVNDPGLILFGPSISSSAAGDNDRNAANLNFSWSYNIYLDGVM